MHFIVLKKVKDYPLHFGLIMIPILYSWRFFSEGSYTYYFLGIVATIGLQLYGIWYYLGKRAEKLEEEKL